MDEITRIENEQNKPIDHSSVKPELSLPSTPNNTKTTDYSQFLDTISARLFTIIKISIFTLILFSIIFTFIKIYSQQGIVMMPFDVSKNEDLTGVAIADQLTAEMLRIQQIHNTKYEEIKLSTNRSYITTKLSTEQSLSSSKLIVPKGEIVDLSMADIGTIDIGPSSLSIGKLIIAFKNICPFSKPVNMIRGSLQRYDSAIVLVAVLEGDNVQSWMLRQPIDNNDDDEEQIHEIINNLAFIIVHDLPQSNISAKTWQGFKYYTEALDTYHQYTLSGNTESLSRAGNYSLEAISSEKGYKNPF